MKNIKEITDIFKQEIKKKYTAQITMPVYMGVSDMEIILEEIERLHSIIKEVREIVEEKANEEIGGLSNKLLEILDKEIKQ